MLCPVCQTPAAAEALACRQCDADLRGLRLLAQLQTHLRAASIAAPEKPRPVGLLAAFTGGALLVGALAGWQLHPKPPEPESATVVTERAKPPVQNDASQPLIARAPSADSLTGPAAASAAAAAISVPAPADTYTYVVRRGDTLRRIAWQLYGRSSLAPRLQALNHISDPRQLQVGQRLRVFIL